MRYKQLISNRAIRRGKLEKQWKETMSRPLKMKSTQNQSCWPEGSNVENLIKAFITLWKWQGLPGKTDW